MQMIGKKVLKIIVIMLICLILLTNVHYAVKEEKIKLLTYNDIKEKNLLEREGFATTEQMNEAFDELNDTSKDALDKKMQKKGYGNGTLLSSKEIKNYTNNGQVRCRLY